MAVIVELFLAVEWPAPHIDQCQTAAKSIKRSALRHTTLPHANVCAFSANSAALLACNYNFKCFRNCRKWNWLLDRCHLQCAGNWLFKSLGNAASENR